MNPKFRKQFKQLELRFPIGVDVAISDVETADLGKEVEMTDDKMFVAFTTDYNGDEQWTVFYNAFPVFIVRQDPLHPAERTSTGNGDWQLMTSRMVGHGEACYGFLQAIGQMGDLSSDNLPVGAGDAIYNLLVQKPWEALEILNDEVLDPIRDDGHALCFFVDRLCALRRA